MAAWSRLKWEGNGLAHWRCRNEWGEATIIRVVITALHEHYRPQVWAMISEFVPYMGSVAQRLRMKTHVSSDALN